MTRTYTCPLCGNQFRAGENGRIRCPNCSFVVKEADTEMPPKGFE